VVEAAGVEYLLPAQLFIRKSLILPEDGWLSVRVFDTPVASGYRLLFVEEANRITRYSRRDQAPAGISVYDRADKSALREAEAEVYSEVARTRSPLNECGVVAFVRFEGPRRCVHATFNLTKAFILQSRLQIFNYQESGEIFGLGWKESGLNLLHLSIEAALV